jgi:hypothetical protein
MFKSSFMPETYAFAILREISNQFPSRTEMRTDISRVQQPDKISISCPSPEFFGEDQYDILYSKGNGESEG